MAPRAADGHVSSYFGHMQLADAYTVRNTFIEFDDAGDDLRRCGARLRSRSVGDAPADYSLPVGARKSPADGSTNKGLRWDMGPRYSMGSAADLGGKVFEGRHDDECTESSVCDTDDGLVFGSRTHATTAGFIHGEGIEGNDIENSSDHDGSTQSGASSSANKAWDTASDAPARRALPLGPPPQGPWMLDESESPREPLQRAVRDAPSAEWQPTVPSAECPPLPDAGQQEQVQEQQHQQQEQQEQQQQQHEQPQQQQHQQQLFQLHQLHQQLQEQLAQQQLQPSLEVPLMLPVPLAACLLPWKEPESHACGDGSWSPWWTACWAQGAHCGDPFDNSPPAMLLPMVPMWPALELHSALQVGVATPTDMTPSSNDGSKGPAQEIHSTPGVGSATHADMRPTRGGGSKGATTWEADGVGPLSGASTVDDVLEVDLHELEALGCSALVDAVHLIAKLSDAEMFGRIERGNILGDRRFEALTTTLCRHASALDTPRLVMRAVWAMGKLGAAARKVDALLAAVAEVLPRLLPEFTAMELSNSLWGLAKLSGAEGGRGCRPSGRATGLASQLVREGLSRIPAFGSQSLSNSVWAVAKLELADRAAQEFCAGCIEQLRSSGFCDTTPQGFANSLWAAAKLRLPPAVAATFCADAARYAMAEPGELACFMSQELSMALWAMARLAGRRPNAGPGSKGGHGEVDAFALGVADEACRRLPEFSPQGVSNIAWSLATLHLARRPPARRFIIAAAFMSMPALYEYPPQAIANICWALSRLHGAERELAAFGAAAAREAMRREGEFSWQDLSGIISAMHVGDDGAHEVRSFAAMLAMRAATCCHSIGTQALLNIALACARLGVSPEVLTPMAWGIAQVFTMRLERLNGIDLRQWVEVQRYCNLPGAAQVGYGGGCGSGAGRDRRDVGRTGARGEFR